MGAGFNEATGDLLMILDADLTVPPEDLPKTSWRPPEDLPNTSPTHGQI